MKRGLVVAPQSVSLGWDAGFTENAQPDLFFFVTFRFFAADDPGMAVSITAVVSFLNGAG